MDIYSYLVEFIGQAINILGVLAISFGIVLSLLYYLPHLVHQDNEDAGYKALRQNLGKTLIIGLELLIAGDIVRSIAIPPTFTNVVILGIIVLIRAFLSIQIERGADWPLRKLHSTDKPQ